jgi:hypothetical protein
MKRRFAPTRGLDWMPACPGTPGPGSRAGLPPSACSLPVELYGKVTPACLAFAAQPLIYINAIPADKA